MAYSALDDIRDEAGFTNNTNVEDADITPHQTRAFARIKGVVGSRYDLSNLTGAGFDSSDAKTILADIERLIAAGRLMNVQYPGDETDDVRIGDRKIEEGEGMLADIMEGNIKLLDENEDEYDLISTNSTLGKTKLVSPDYTNNDFKDTDVW